MACVFSIYIVSFFWCVYLFLIYQLVLHCAIFLLSFTPLGAMGFVCIFGDFLTHFLLSAQHLCCTLVSNLVMCAHHIFDSPPSFSIVHPPVFCTLHNLPSAEPRVVSLSITHSPLTLTLAFVCFKLPPCYCSKHSLFSFQSLFFSSLSSHLPLSVSSPLFSQRSH